MSYSVSKTHCTPKEAIGEIDFQRANGQRIPDRVYDNAVAVLESYEAKGVTLLDFNLYGHNGVDHDDPPTPGSYTNTALVVTVLEVKAG